MQPRPCSWRFWLASIVLLPACGLAGGGDWPRFRGPNGAGTAADKDVPVKWTDENILWKTAIPGVGHSSPIVCKGRIFLQSAAEEGGERWLLCIDAAKGEILWKTRSPGELAKKHPLNSFASSTPATDGQRVYAAFWDGRAARLGAYDFKDGKPLWNNDLGSYSSQHGFGHSPMLIDGKVILANDQDGASHLLAFDAKSGGKVWQTERRPYRACYSTPIIRVKPDGGKELIVASTTSITGYNPADGKPNWWYTWKFAGKSLRTVGSPILAGNLVIATSGDGDGSRDVIAVKLGSQGDVSGTNLVWQDRRTRYFPYVSCFLSRGDYLYSVSDTGWAACHDARTGKEVWRESLCKDGFTASPILVDGKVYAVNQKGVAYVFEAAPKFKLLARNRMGEAVSSTPAVADNRLFIRDETHLFCIGNPTAASR
ncbi:MAG TPA: PQQ-binding-like beta-propeller repeat protein [Gemmataceae bacterium]|nr:PQQ-binding-like beta-propeller repeat protein [Gemmataceae bacterium]